VQANTAEVDRRTDQEYNWQNGERENDGDRRSLIGAEPRQLTSDRV
jgi:hypothetical protein